MKPPKKLDLRKVVMGLALLLPALAGCHPSYSAKSITTRVLDSETKTPIQGVIVVAYWSLETQNGPTADLMLLETTTDSSGTFHFPAWGPKKAPIGQLLNADPTILLFKDGYKSELVQNTYRGVDVPEHVRSFYYDGKDVEMHKFAGTLKDWGTHLEWFQQEVVIATAGRCEWTNIPKLITALGKESVKLKAAGIFTRNYYDELVALEPYQQREGCGSVREFLKEQD